MTGTDPVGALLARWPFGEICAAAVAATRDAPDHALLETYGAALANAAFGSPAFYDEIHYLGAHPTVLAEVRAGRLTCGLHHFLGWGIFEVRMPNPDWARAAAEAQPVSPPTEFDPHAYLRNHPDVAAFLADIPQITATDFARSFGTMLGHFAAAEAPGPLQGTAWPVMPAAATSDLPSPQPAPEPTRGGVATRLERLRLLAAYFDPDWYRARYMAAAPGAEPQLAHPFDHYLREGARAGHSPGPAFDEAFYLTFYPDVADAVRAGTIRCGFEHWLLAGEAEGRLPRFELVSTLEALYPGVTKPNAIELLDAIEAKLRPCPAEVEQASPPRVWIVLPFLNPDLMFGGFASILAFLEALLARGIRLGLFLREAQAAQAAYFRFRSRQATPLVRALDRIPIFSPLEGKAFRFGPRDVFVSYSVWDGHWARHFAQRTRWKRPIYWIQEYEPIFHKHDSLHFVGNSAYHYDHVGIFNSALLRDWFRGQRIGLYDGRPGRVDRSLTYEHLLWHHGAPHRAERRRDRRRRFFVYARPEDHATRNLFEVAVIALRRAVESGVFTGAWQFIGLGALAGPYAVPLGRGYALEVRNRVPPAEYAAFIHDVDVGLSLMYAPHPSLLPYEIARSGAMVVTNTVPGRDAAYISARSRNIIPCDPTIDDVVRAIKDAVRRAGDATPEPSDPAFPDTRIATWGDIFDDAFIKSVGGMMGRGFDWAAFCDKA